MAYCTAKEAYNLTMKHKAEISEDVKNMLPEIMKDISDYITFQASLGKGNISCDVKYHCLNTTREFVSIITDELANEFCELGFRVVKANWHTLKIVWYV